MKTKHILLPALAAIPAALLCTSCIEEDWDDDYYGTRRGPRYGYYDRYDDDYDDGYRAGYEDRRRDERYERRHDDRHHRDDRRDGTPRPHIPKGFVRAGSYTSGKTIEAPIPTRNPIKQILLAGTTGSATINTVVLREGAKTTRYPLAIHLPAGQTQMIELGGHRQATGIRVSTGGHGTFDIYVH
jgi:hypothetical protein